MPEISVIIVSYNSASFLRDCLASVFACSQESCEVIVVDNASQDGSRDLIRKEFPSVSLVSLACNIGFGAACNRGAAVAAGRYLVFLNPDTVVEPGWLRHLVRVLETDASVGAVSPKIVLMDQPDIVNACGNDVHIVGFPSCHLWGAPSDQVQAGGEVASISGAAFIISKALFDRVGRFDPHFFMYLEDTDLSWRLRLSGYHCLYVPQAVVRHCYQLSFGPQKVFWLERNRYWLLAKNLRSATLLSLAPALVLAELLSWGYVLLRGPRHLAAKASADWWALRHWRAARRTGRLSRQTRPAHLDRDLLRCCSVHIPHEVAHPGRLARLTAALADPLYAVCRWFAMAV